MTKNERLELNELSKKVYGSANKWSKMVNKGERGALVEKLEDGTERTYQGIVYYKVEEIKSLMEDLWKEEQELKAKQEAEAENEANKKDQEVSKEVEETKPDVVKEILETVGDWKMTYLSKIVHKVSGYNKNIKHDVPFVRCDIQKMHSESIKTSTKWGRINCPNCLKTKMKKF